MEGGFPFVSFDNADQMVCMLEVDFGVNASLVGRIYEVGDEGKWVSIFFCDSVESTEIYRARGTHLSSLQTGPVLHGMTMSNR